MSVFFTKEAKNEKSNFFIAFAEYDPYSFLKGGTFENSSIKVSGNECFSAYLFNADLISLSLFGLTACQESGNNATYEQITPEKAKTIMSELEHLSMVVKIPEMVQLMKRTVPEFISKNSEFEKYDVVHQENQQ